MVKLSRLGPNHLPSHHVFVIIVNVLAIWLNVVSNYPLIALTKSNGALRPIAIGEI